jgi:hypothetical protein
LFHFTDCRDPSRHRRQPAASSLPFTENRTPSAITPKT